MSEHLRKLYIKDDYYEELNESSAAGKEHDPGMINETRHDEFRFHRDSEKNQEERHDQ